MRPSGCPAGASTARPRAPSVPTRTPWPQAGGPQATLREGPFGMMSMRLRWPGGEDDRPGGVGFWADRGEWARPGSALTGPSRTVRAQTCSHSPVQWFSSGGGSPPWQCLQTFSMITAVGGATGTSWVEARRLLRVGQCTGRPTEDQGLDVTGAAGGKFPPKAQNS